MHKTSYLVALPVSKLMFWFMLHARLRTGMLIRLLWQHSLDLNPDLRGSKFNNSFLPLYYIFLYKRYHSDNCYRSNAYWKHRLIRLVPPKQPHLAMLSSLRSKGNLLLWKLSPHQLCPWEKVWALLWAQVTLYSLRTVWHCFFWIFLWFCL